MLAPLPTGGYQWVDPETWDDALGQKIKARHCFHDILEDVNASPINYYLEVDAEFPPEIHEKMSDYPMLPEHMIPPGSTSPVGKLINHLGPRRKYVLAYETYLLALQHGVIFTKIHRILQFNQSCWLKRYIEFNTEKRQQANNEFEKSWYKLMNNSLFGKFLEDVTKFMDFELFHSGNSKKYRQIHIKKPFLIKQETIYNQCPLHLEQPLSEVCTLGNSCVVGMEKRKKVVKLNRPILIGSKVLESSKVLMYDTFYNKLQPYFGKGLKLCATDTDSFILNIQTSNLSKDLHKLRQHWDFSNYPRDHELYDKKKCSSPREI